jgi:NCAIR mutase (PurE)-related protein
MAGRPQLPKELKKQRVTIRLRPWLVQLVKEQDINLSQLVEEVLLSNYDHCLDKATVELAKKFKVGLPELVDKSLDKNE